jgi:hypothetical protein
LTMLPEGALELQACDQNSRGTHRATRSR